MKQSSGTVPFQVDLERGELAGRRALVTGAAGFIGAHLVRRLVRLGCHVVAVVRPNSDLWRIQDHLDRVELIKVDLKELDPVWLEKTAGTVHQIYHLAATGVNPVNQDPVALVQTNVAGTLALLTSACRLQVERFVYCGSCFEYGAGLLQREDSPPAPVSEYGATKSAAWLLVDAFHRKYGLPVTTLRPFTVYGPLEAPYRLVPYSVQRGLDGEELELSGGEQLRDMVYIEDAVQAFFAAGLRKEAIGKTFNVCTGAAVSVKQVVGQILDLTGNRAVPRFGVRPYRADEIWTLSGDPTQSREVLGWTAQTSLREGLCETVEWFRQHRSQHAIYSTGPM